MGSNLNACGVCFLVLLVLLNILFMALGLVLISVGSWSIAVGSDFAFVTGNNLISGAALLIVTGITIVLVCGFGILGAVFKWRPVLVVYAVIVGIVALLDIVAGIVAIAFRHSFADSVDKYAMDAYREYAEGPILTDEQIGARGFIIFSQDWYDCCGYNNASDWITLNPKILLANQVNGTPAPPFYSDPDDGCYRCDPSEKGCATFRGTIENNVSVSFNVTTKGCRSDVHSFVVSLTSVVGGLGIVIGVIESLGVIFALLLCCFITSGGD